MMQVQIDRDLVIARGETIPGHPLPAALAKHSIESLRFDGATVIDPTSRTAFAIDPTGRKRLPEMAEADWPVVECGFDASLLLEDGGWRVETEADRLARQREATSMPKPAFLAAAFREGALTKAEAVEAGLGAWPAAFEPVLEGMSDEEEVEARAHWSAVSTVVYGYPTTRLVAQIGAGRTGRTVEELLDAIFGIEA